MSEGSQAFPTRRQLGPFGQTRDRRFTPVAPNFYDADESIFEERGGPRPGTRRGASGRRTRGRGARRRDRTQRRRRRRTVPVGGARRRSPLGAGRSATTVRPAGRRRGEDGIGGLPSTAAPGDPGR